MSWFVQWLESIHEDVTVTNKCVRTGNLNSNCTICVEACHLQLLTVENGSIRINMDLCTSCGDCIISCPLSAIEGVLAGRQFEKGSLLFNSQYVPTVKELLIYKKMGIQSIRTKDYPLNTQWEQALTAANYRLRQLSEIPLEVVNSQSREEVSRREFFAVIKKQSKQAAKEMTPASWRINQKGWKLADYYPDYSFYTVELDKQRCTLCYACLSYCSQNVFSLSDLFLQIHPERCVHCTNCVDICPENAIVIREEVTHTSEIQEHFEIRTCRICNKLFPTFKPETDSCPICTSRGYEWLSPVL